jgi:hypothetical protein
MLSAKHSHRGGCCTAGRRTWRATWAWRGPTNFRSHSAAKSAPVDVDSRGELEGVLADLLTDDVDEREGSAPPLPPAAREIFAGLLSSDAAGSWPFRFCFNCCQPLPEGPLEPAAPCRHCGHLRTENDKLLGDSGAWVQAYQHQLSAQQAGQSRTSPSDSGRGANTPPEVLLATDARMLLHRASLPPYPERCEGAPSSAEHFVGSLQCIGLHGAAS